METYDKENENNDLKFPCIIDGKYIKINDCMNCHKHTMCDIYATMLDEIYDT